MPDPIRSRPISTRHPKFAWPWDPIGTPPAATNRTRPVSDDAIFKQVIRDPEVRARAGKLGISVIMEEFNYRLGWDPERDDDSRRFAASEDPKPIYAAIKPTLKTSRTVFPGWDTSVYPPKRIDKDPKP